jgi:hypothetical protein
LIVPVLPAEQALLLLQLLPRVVELQAVAQAPGMKDASPVVGTEPVFGAPLQVPAITVSRIAVRGYMCRASCVAHVITAWRGSKGFTMYSYVRDRATQQLELEQAQD